MELDLSSTAQVNSTDRRGCLQAKEGGNVGPAPPTAAADPTAETQISCRMNRKQISEQEVNLQTTPNIRTVHN